MSKRKSSRVPDSGENELRLTGPAPAVQRFVQRLLAHGGEASTPTTHALHGVYWDTPALDLRAAGLALRVRTTDGADPVLGLKAMRQDPTLRDEYEVPISEARVKLSSLVAAGWKAPPRLLTLEGGLAPVFATQVVRRKRTLEFADGTLVELADDRGEIVLAGEAKASEPIAEIELEFVAGDVRSLHALASRCIGEVPGLRLLFASKSERGYRLLGGGMPSPRNARRVRAKPDMPASMLAVMAASEALAQVALNVEGARGIAPEEPIHQLRVGVRRYRTGLSMARAAGLPVPADALRDALRVLWDLLGKARDADVFATETWPAVCKGNASPAGQAVAEGLERERARRHRTLREALDAPRFQQMMLAALWAVEHQREASAKTPGKSTKALGRALVRRRRDRFLELGRKLETMAPTARHQFRLRAKKLRYTTEFFADALPAKASRRFLRRLEDVQTALGELNDLAAANALVTSMTRPLADAPRREARALWHAWTAERRATLERGLARAWKRLRTADPLER